MQVSKNILGLLWILLLTPTETTGECTLPTTSPHVILKTSDILNSTFDEESIVSFHCSPGYEPTPQSPRRFTCSQGQWKPDPERFSCQKKSCGDPGSFPNGHYEYPDGVQFGAVVTAVCKTGYFLKGWKTRTCLANGQWDGRHPVCEEKACGDPGSFPNGHYEYPDGVQFGAVITAVCKTGYFIIGMKTRTCLPTGQWDGRNPFCEVMKCGPPPTVVNGYLHSPLNEEGYEYGHIVQYVCDSGYILFGDNEPAETVQCLEDGSWSKAPRCTKVSCSLPHIPNARRVEGGSGPYHYRYTLRYECNEGYKMASSDEGRMVCLEDGWSSKPECQAECKSPLGMKSRLISDRQLSASSHLSVWNGEWLPHYARLDQTGRVNAWSAATNSRSQWLQVDLLSRKHVTGIITQGAKDFGEIQFVSTFKVEYSHDGTSWQTLKDPTYNTDKVFQGNKDNNTHMKNMFNPPFYARFVRLLPWAWHNHITVRMELLGCDD